MTRVSRVKCDACNAEVDEGSKAASQWFQLVRYPTMDDYERYDFCSLGCLERWSSRRALVAGIGS